MTLSKSLFSSFSDDWATPKGIYRQLNDEFQFDFDPCPLKDNLAFVSEWGKRCFVNPPYSDIRRFLEKALAEIEGGRTEVAVFLIPSRTDTKWWHELVMPNASDIRFIKGRLKFNDSKNPAPFPSCIVILKGRSR